MSPHSGNELKVQSRHFYDAAGVISGFKRGLKSSIHPSFFSICISRRQKQTHRGKRKHWKDERHICRRLWVCNFAGSCWWVMASFFPREKRWRVSSLMCFTSADLISRPAPSHGRQISFSRADVMSRHWVDTGQCWGTRLTDDNRSSILIVFLFLCPARSLSPQSLFFCGRLTVCQKRSRTSRANVRTHSWVIQHVCSLRCLRL